MKTSNPVRSCSSMVATEKVTKNGELILAKNSDRPLNEAQPLCYFPSRDYEPGEEVQCTYIKVPQVSHTYACIGSRPYVFFGFEHGVNEWGVAIGNEQVSGKEIPERQWGLIGMDILRLALERANTAEMAVEIMGSLLEEYGTGGDPGTRISAFNSNYIVADGKEAYLFESHQRSWVAKKVDKVGHLSNCYCIGQDYTFIGESVVQEAEEKGWVLPGQTFVPRDAWTIDDCVFGEAEGFARYARMQELMNPDKPIDMETMMKNLRDHYEDTFLVNIPYGPASAKFPSICSHPGGVSGCATAASMVTILRKDVPKELRFTYWASMAPPCCSIFHPHYNTGKLPVLLQNAGPIYHENDPWWRFIELERYVALNYQKFAPKVKELFAALELEFIQEAAYIEKNYNGDIGGLESFSDSCFQQSLDLCVSQIHEIKRSLITKDIDRLSLRYFVESSNGCGMPYDHNTIK